MTALVLLFMKVFVVLLDVLCHLTRILKSTLNKMEWTFNRLYNRGYVHGIAADIHSLKQGHLCYKLYFIWNKSNRCKLDLETHMLKLELFLWFTTRNTFMVWLHLSLWTIKPIYIGKHKKNEKIITFPQAYLNIKDLCLLRAHIW